MARPVGQSDEAMPIVVAGIRGAGRQAGPSGLWAVARPGVLVDRLGRDLLIGGFV